MKKITQTLLILIAFVSCKTAQEEAKTTIAPVTSAMMETAVIYEANIRQYSPEGTFDAFTKDIPQLKKLGVKVIWLMPIFPISETNRKAKGDLMVHDIKDAEERKKYLGSYYAVSDFTKINPEFGTIEDFRELVKAAHENGIYIILDWVPNHTGWDHKWLKTNPEFYTKNDQGAVIYPEGTDWTDVADLNYDNKDLHTAMIADLKYWITEEGVDGYRCDVAGSVPTTFWEKAIPQLRAEKALFMLAEAWEPELLKEGLFDMAYAWEGHAIMNAIAKEEKGVKEWSTYMEKMSTEYEEDDILMNFITNHDENSWNGTINERMKGAAEMLLALSYVSPGMPLIYSGQEYDLNHRLKFFEKDSIPKEKGNMWSLLEKLGKLKTSNFAMHGGKNAANYKNIATANENVLVFTREKEGQLITFVANFSGKEQKINNAIKGEYVNYMIDEKVAFTDETISLRPWEYMILTH
ncbi:MAG: alpha-amylase family glycosyl hydrolase [Polaribacter sp.]|nr:alpha-amylase family glycosyl hydrolase [Polaribacter sp.]